jgi:hypothetical protein
MARVFILQSLTQLSMVMPAVAKRRTYMAFDRMFGWREMALRARDADRIDVRTTTAGCSCPATPDAGTSSKR